MYIQKVKEFRLKKGLSQEQVAQVIGVSRPTYTAIEAGKQKLDLDEAQKLAKLFGIGVDELLFGAIPNIEKYKHMILTYLRMNLSKDGKMCVKDMYKYICFQETNPNFPFLCKLKETVEYHHFQTAHANTSV